MAAFSSASAEEITVNVKWVAEDYTVRLCGDDTVGEVKEGICEWVEVKMKELAVLNSPNYKVTALLDHLAMISVQTESRGVFDCKPLGLIWEKFPQFYSKRNTIMFDDLKRNFVMNPQNGLVIRPFRKAHLNRTTDRELVGLTQYLLAIAELESFEGLDHSRWERYSES